MSTHKRRGFTLIELLVVIAIIGILIALLLPAIQAAREAARKATCANNLTQLGVALQHYQAAHEVLPPGTIEPQGPIRNVPKGYHMGWLVQLLPYVEEGVTFKNVDFSVGVYHKNNAPARNLGIALFTCPSYSGSRGLPPELPVAWVSNYAGCHHDVEAPIDEDNNGVFFLNSHISSRDVTDGTTHTIFVGEKLAGPQDLGWMSGTRATLRNTGTPINMTAGEGPFQWPGDPGIEFAPPEEGPSEVPLEGREAPKQPEGAADDKAALEVGGFGSEHTGGGMFLFGDGAVRFISQDINTKVYQQLGHRADGKLLKGGPTRDGPQ